MFAVFAFWGRRRRGKSPDLGSSPQCVLFGLIYLDLFEETKLGGSPMFSFLFLVVFVLFFCQGGSSFQGNDAWAWPASGGYFVYGFGHGQGSWKFAEMFGASWFAASRVQGLRGLWGH